MPREGHRHEKTFEKQWRFRSVLIRSAFPASHRRLPDTSDDKLTRREADPPQIASPRVWPEPCKGKDRGNMNSTQRRITMTALTVLVPALVILAGDHPVKSQSKNGYAGGIDLVDKAGNIRKPVNVRDLYQLLGTYSVVDLNGDTEMHVTQASRGAAEYYRKNGKFADGTVLVKEIFGTEHASL